MTAQSQGNPAATPKTCNYAGGPPCPAPPPLVGPWHYGVDPHYDGYFPSSLVHSFDDVDYYYQLKFQGGGWCTSTRASIEPGTPVLSEGLESSNYYTLTYNDTAFKFQNGSDAPCTEKWTSNAVVLRYRSIACPANTSNVYQASPLIGPYCEPPPVATNVLKQVGPCCTNGGGPSAGRTTKGEPVDASNGNLYESEVDYAPGAANALRFIRSYNSLSGVNQSSGARDQFGTQYLGIGWSATYFQYLTPMTVTDSTTTYSAVYAFRPDGRVLIFNLYNGVYSSDGDVQESLVQTPAGWAYQTGDDTIENYSSDGQLVSITPRGQAPIIISYTHPGDPPSAVSDAFGHTLQFTYALDSSGTQRLSSVTDPSGATIQYSYDNNANLVSVTYQDGSVRGYTYGTNNLSHALTTLTDEASVAYSNWTYNGNGLVTGNFMAGGVAAYSITYSTSGAGGSSSVTDPLGQVRTYPQQLVWGSYRMTGSSAPLPGSREDSARTYDASGNVTSRTDFNGNVDNYSYDALRNLETSRTEAVGTPQARTITSTWDPNWRQPSLITEPNRTTSFTYDSMGNVLSQVVTDTTSFPSASRTWIYTYDSYGRLLTAKGPRTDLDTTTSYTYYTCTSGFECGQLRTVTDAVGNVTEYHSYNAHGQPLTLTDANGVLITLVYDARLRLISSTAGVETTSFAYYPTGLLQAVTMPDGSTLRYSYDGAHRLVQIIDGAGNSLQYALDAMGNRIGESAYDPSAVLSRAVSRVFNSLNQLSQTVGSAGTLAVTTTFGYDSSGNQTSIVGPMDRTAKQAYDALDRLTKATDPNGGNTLFTYDSDDNLTALQDPIGLTTSYSYNAFGDLLGEVSPRTGGTINTFDSGGNLSTSQDARGVITHYSYDALNRVTQIGYGDQLVRYFYDSGINGKGRLTVASDSAHSLTWQYDALGRVSLKTQTVGQVIRSVGYTYGNGNLVSLTTPSGQSITYTYSNHLVSAINVNGVPLVSNVSYEPFGPSREWTWGNGTTETRLHDADGNPGQFTGAESVSYVLDSAFRIVGITNAQKPGLSWNLDYDNMDRITMGANADATLSWTYDGDGNRTGQTGAPPPTYSASALVLAYNNRGRLASVTTAGGTTNYLYDALGQRIEKMSPSGTVIFVYDEAGHLIGEYDGSGNLVEETVWLEDLPIATLVPNGTSGVSIFYIHADHLDTPRAITRPSDNAIVWRWDQNPYGATQPDQNPSGLGTFIYNLRFPGQYYDVESGLNSNGFRDYDSAVGKYVESDPLGLAGGIDTYDYAASNPISLADPSGLQSNAACANPANFAVCEAADMIWQQATKNAAKKAAQAAAAGAAAATQSRSSDCCTDYKLIYEPNDKHRKERYYFRGDPVARAPTAGQPTLDTSIPTGSPSERRVGYDAINSELVVFPLTRTDPVNCIKYFHGWVADYFDDVYGRDDILKTIRKAGFPTPW